MMFFSCSNTIQ